MCKIVAMKSGSGNKNRTSGPVVMFCRVQRKNTEKKHFTDSDR